MTEELKLYSLDNRGNYIVNFPNRHALSLDEIKQRFSAFSPVLAVRAAGDERGFRFVSFATVEDATAAIEGIKNDPQIKLVVRKPKNGNSNNNNHNSNDRTYLRKNFDNSKSNKYNHNNTSPANSVKSIKTNGDSGKSNSSFIKANDNEDEKLKMEHLAEVRGYISNVFDVQSEKDSFNKQSNSTENRTQDMPSLIPARKAQRKLEIISAQEIIIANIHDTFGCAYILHLLEKYDPISITKICTVKNLNLRFCHVYFKTINDAEAVIEDFDNYNLHGKKLIIIKPE